LRGDAWCRLEEAADRLTRPTTDGGLKERYVAICQDLLTQLTPLEPYWAYLGSPQFARVQRLFAGGSYDKFAHAVTRINRDVRRAFYLSYDDTNCEYLTGEEIEAKLDAGVDVVSATFVTPYPPGFPVLVPGQVVSRQILAFIRDLDTPEIHGYKPDFGYRVYTEKASEMCRPADAPIGNGHRPLPAESPGPAPTVDTSQPSSRKTGAKRPGKPPEPAPAPA
jgi:hypothetical protein